jgi:hypothetical protein
MTKSAALQRLRKVRVMARTGSTKYHIRVRKFLNRDPEYPAFVIGIVEDTTGIPDTDEKQSWNNGDIELEIGDCYRRVSFDFRMYDKQDRANSLYKINRLAEVVVALRDAIEIEVNSRNARPATKPKQKK